MDKSEHRANIRRLADELAMAMTEAGETYELYIFRPWLPAPDQDPNAYVATLTVTTSEEL